MTKERFFEIATELGGDINPNDDSFEIAGVVFTPCEVSNDGDVERVTVEVHNGKSCAISFSINAYSIYDMKLAYSKGHVVIRINYGSSYGDVRDMEIALT